MKTNVAQGFYYSVETNTKEVNILNYLHKNQPTNQPKHSGSYI